MIENKKKIILYTGNHNNQTGIIDYIETIERLISDSGHYFLRSKSLSKLLLKKYDLLIIIDEFSTLEKILATKLLISQFKEKIIILTEFTNKEKNTFNTFDDRLPIEFLFYARLKEIIYLFISRSFVITIIFLLVIFFIKKIKLFLFRLYIYPTLIIQLFFALLIFISGKKLFFSIRISKIFFKKFTKEIRYKLTNFKKLSIDTKSKKNLKDNKYMKLRYLGFNLVIGDFNKILISHDKIFADNNNYFNNNFIVNRIYFNIKNTKVNYDNKKKLILTVSGTINPYRISVLKNIYECNNPFFDYSQIQRIINSNYLGFITLPLNNPNCNYCSIHIKKSKNWSYSSPTRYINSLNKNEIPIILDEFTDLESKLLTLKKNVLNIKNWSDFDKEINILNSGITYYKKFVNEHNNRLKKIYF
jgi:hypothetical protein